MNIKRLHVDDEEKSSLIQPWTRYFSAAVGSYLLGSVMEKRKINTYFLRWYANRCDQKNIVLIRSTWKNVSNVCVRAQTQHTSIENRWCRLEISEKLEFQQLYDSYPLQCTLGEAARVNFDRRGVDKARKSHKIHSNLLKSGK